MMSIVSSQYILGSITPSIKAQFVGPKRIHYLQARLGTTGLLLASGEAVSAALELLPPGGLQGVEF
jgi:hypothetical protein